VPITLIVGWAQTRRLAYVESTRRKSSETAFWNTRNKLTQQRKSNKTNERKLLTKQRIREKIVLDRIQRSGEKR
jgi:hypothetical protein